MKTKKQITSKRAKLVAAAVQDETQRLNQALESGALVILKTAFGPYVLEYVSVDLWYHTHPAGQRRDNFNHRSFAGCNDGTWANLLKQAGVERNPLFADKPEAMRGVQNDDDSTRDMWNAPRAKR